MLCPNCFDEKQSATYCPTCSFVELGKRDSKFLNYRDQLQNEQYIIGKVLGGGGFGVVYKALDTHLGALVAIKECLITQSNQIYRLNGVAEVQVNEDFQLDYDKWLSYFQKEASYIAKFKNEYIVRVINDFKENNTAYYVMPFIDGYDLKKHCKNNDGTLDVDTVVRLSFNLLSALEEIHSMGVYHRDIKPSNIFITGNEYEPVLIDFGLSRTNFDTEQSLMHMSSYSGEYAAYEQVMGLKDQGSHTDIYALCATLYYCLTGEGPPKAQSRVVSAEGIADPYVPIQNRISKIDPLLAKLINKGLEPNWKNRIQNATEAIEIIRPLFLNVEAKKKLASLNFKKYQQENSSEGLSGAEQEVTGLKDLSKEVNSKSNPISASKSGLNEPISVSISFNKIIEQCQRFIGQISSLVVSYFQTSDSEGSKLFIDDSNKIRKVKISVLEDPLIPRIYCLSAGESMTIGRSSKADIIISKKIISNRHAVISIDELFNFKLTDLDSLNHTYINKIDIKDKTIKLLKIKSVSGKNAKFTLGSCEKDGVQIEIFQIFENA